MGLAPQPTPTPAPRHPGQQGALFNEPPAGEQELPSVEEVPAHPSWYEMHWLGVKSAAVEAATNVPGHFDQDISTQLSVMAGQLARANGMRPDHYNILIPGQSDMGVAVTDEAAFYADLAKKRLADPTFLADAGSSRADFTKRMRDKYTAESQQRQREMAKQGWVGNLAGGVIGSGLDPVNIATLPFGMGEAGIARRVLGEGVINLLTDVAETPSLQAERVRQGQPLLTTGEVLTDWRNAFGMGMVMTGGHIATGKALGAAWNKLPETTRTAIAKAPDDLKMALTFRAMVPEESWTPSQRAAINVIERHASIEASSPYHEEYKAVGAHVAKMNEAMNELAREPVPTSEKIARPEPVARPRGSGVMPNQQIVDGLKARGFSEVYARGIAAGIHAESRGNPRAEGPMQPSGHGALGIGQWLGPRRDAIIAQYGEHPTLDQQLDFLAAELRGGDPGGAKVLAQKDEAAVMRSYVKDFMRPAEGIETQADIDRGMAALGRKGEAVPETTLADGTPMPEVRPEALDVVRPLIEGEPLEISQPIAREGMELVDPKEDRFIGTTIDGHPLFERADGQRYKLDPFNEGMPRFGGDLVPVERAPVAAPGAAEPAAAPEAPAPKGGAPVAAKEQPKYNREDFTGVQDTTLPNARKGWQGVPDAEVSTAETPAGRFTYRHSMMTPEGGHAHPFRVTESFETRAEAQRAGLERIAKEAVEREGDAPGVAKVKARVRTWVDDELAKLPPAQRIVPTPVARDALEATGNAGYELFDPNTAKVYDDPAGQGKAETVMSIWHDVEAVAKAAADTPLGAKYDLGDGKGMRSIEHIDADLKKQEAGIQAARDCLL